MTKPEEKAQLRREIRAAEKQLPEAYKAASAAAICARLTALPGYRSAGTVFCFVGAGQEIDTQPFLLDALSCGKRLCVPFCTGPGRMELRSISSLSQLSPGAYGILEPTAECPSVPLDEVDFTVVPCLTCDRSGRRLGQGGGYYDRFLASYRASAVLVCRERLLRAELPAESRDRPVPWVMTERAFYEDGIPAGLD